MGRRMKAVQYIYISVSMLLCNFTIKIKIKNLNYVIRCVEIIPQFSHRTFSYLRDNHINFIKLSVQRYLMQFHIMVCLSNDILAQIKDKNNLAPKSPIVFIWPPSLGWRRFEQQWSARRKGCVPDTGFYYIIWYFFLLYINIRISSIVLD